jgi:branched-chain amino acid transport system permease protein
MIIICLIGGAGTLWGPWIGAFILFAIQELLRTLSTSTVFLQWQAVIFSVLIVLVVLFLPRGLMQIIQGNARFTPRLFWRNLTANRV